MQTFHYDGITGEYLFADKAFVDPLESQKSGQTKFLLPRNATFIAPPDEKSGYARIWNGQNWEYIADFRGVTVWKNHHESMTVSALGDIPAGWSITRPEKPLSASDYDRVLEQHIHDTRVARGYTTREPSCYLQSSVSRWKQDALDWVAFVDECMLYGLDIQNRYASGETVPTLEEFKANLPQIVWQED